MTISKTTLQTIITDPNGAKTLVREANALGKELAKNRLTTNQIRALFGEVRQIEAQWQMGNDQRKKAERRLILLKPKMAYRAKRERGRGVKELVSVLDPAIDLVIDEEEPQRKHENFQRFVEFFEAILAYHKAHGGN